MMMRQDYWIHKLRGGMIGESGPHAVYKSLAFIGEVKEVSVHTRSFLEHPWAPFDEFRIELVGERANSSILVSYHSNMRASTIDLLGDDGILHLDLLSMLLLHHAGTDSMKLLSLGRYSLSLAAQIIGGVAGNAFDVITRRAKPAHDVVIEGFIDSVLGNNQPPVTGEEGRETVRVMELIVEKLKQKYGTHSA